MSAYVHYHCPCIVQRAPPTTIDSPGQILYTPGPPKESVEPRKPLNPADPPATSSFTAYPIAQLAFCEDCHQLKCDQCLQHDIVCYYCPNCLFEVPTASVKGERNRCMRNCFSCPYCTSTLAVVAEEASAALQSTGGRYFLSCPTCRFDSREDAMQPTPTTSRHHGMQQSQRVGQYMVFDRPTGLASQVQKADDMRPDAREFDLLKDHFERLLRTNAGFPVTVTPATGLVLPPRYTSVRAPSTRVAISVTGESASGHAADTQVMEDDMDGNFMGVVLDHDHVEDEGRVVEDLITLTEADQISTLAQRSTQLADEPYHLARIRQERIHLRVKRSKRCRSCRHVIVKPEQKAVATRFKINILAMHYVPIITLMQLTELRQGESQRIVLKFTNPLYFPIRIKLSSPDKQVKILAHDFSVGDFSDVFEYEEELSGLNARSATYVAMRRSASGRSATLPTGIWDQRSNFTAIIIDVQPTEPTADYCIPLLVYYAYVETPEEDDDFSVEEEEEEDDEEMDEGGSQASATLRLKKRQEDSVKSSEDDGGILREMEFWATIGLGKVVPKPQELQIPYSNDALFMD